MVKATSKKSNSRLQNSSSRPKGLPKAVIAALVIMALLFIGGLFFVFVVLGVLGHNVKEGLDQAGIHNITELAQYPNSYVAAGLPQYPGADVVHLGNKNAKPTEGGGVVLYVNTDDDIVQAANFYSDKLSADGWHVDVNQSITQNQAGLITRVYSKDKQKFTLTVSRDDKNHTTNIVITWAESQP